MRRLLRYALRQWKLYLTSAVFLVLGVYLAALGPKLIQKIRYFIRDGRLEYEPCGEKIAVKGFHPRRRGEAKGGYQE